MTRRELLWGGGTLMASLTLAACGGSASSEDGTSDAGEQGATAQEVTEEAAVTPPDEREFWVCVTRTAQSEIVEIDQESGEESKRTNGLSWTATLDDHGNVVSVEGESQYSEGENQSSLPMSALFEVNEDGLLTHFEDSQHHVRDVSYECDDEGRPVTCSVKGTDVSGTDHNYILSITYNDLGDIETLSYDDGSGNTRDYEFDKYGVGVLRHKSDERNERGLPTHSTHNRIWAEASGPEEESYEYDDAGNLVRYTYTYEGSIEDKMVMQQREEISFEYEQIKNPSLAVRLGSHLWGCLSSTNDLIGDVYEEISETGPAWENI